MKLYHISQKVNDDYDTFDSAIVAAPDEEAARDIDPAGAWDTDSQQRRALVDWTKPSGCWAPFRAAVVVREIGTANEGVEQGVICASFNAG